MVRFALKGILGRKLRTALTAIAIVLGVAMVAGTFMLTDSIDKAFDSIFTDVRKGSNAVVTGKSAFDLSEGSGTNSPTLDESLLPEVRRLPSVAEAEGGVDGEAQLIGEDGKAIVYGGAPNLGFSVTSGDSPFNPLTLVEGAWPKAGELVVDKSTADKEDFRLGESIGVQAEGPAQRLRISGLVRFGSVSTIGGATLAGFDLPTAQELFGKRGRLDEIAVAAKPGVSDEELVRDLQAELPPTAQVKTGSQQARDDAAETNSFISFLRGFLLAFGGIALFVGAFVIANSLSITIAQRTREFATVRTIGGSRRQLRTEGDQVLRRNIAGDTSCSCVASPQRAAQHHRQHVLFLRADSAADRAERTRRNGDLAPDLIGRNATRAQHDGAGRVKHRADRRRFRRRRGVHTTGSAGLTC